jgi:hypothetical protein
MWEIISTIHVLPYSLNLPISNFYERTCVPSQSLTCEHLSSLFITQVDNASGAGLQRKGEAGIKDI